MGIISFDAIRNLIVYGDHSVFDPFIWVSTIYTLQIGFYKKCKHARRWVPGALIKQ
jgi:hypothetical protein